MSTSRKSKPAQPNLRPLSAITADIYRAERQNLFSIGKLLREAKEHFPHGEWLPYLKSIDYSARNAQIYMSASELADKYETIAHLGAAPTAIYALNALAAREAEAEREVDVIPLASERLQASIARGDSAGEQRAIVELSPMAMLNPGVCELALGAASIAINQSCFGCEIRMKSMEEQCQAILQGNPTTEDELRAIQAKHPVLWAGGKMTQDEFIKLQKDAPEVEDDDDDEEDDAGDDDDESPVIEIKSTKGRKVYEQKTYDTPQEAHANAPAIDLSAVSAAWDRVGVVTSDKKQLEAALQKLLKATSEALTRLRGKAAA